MRDSSPQSSQEDTSKDAMLNNGWKIIIFHHLEEPFVIHKPQNECSSINELTLEEQFDPKQVNAIF
jgi:hypothetical protein